MIFRFEGLTIGNIIITTRNKMKKCNVELSSDEFLELVDRFFKRGVKK